MRILIHFLRRANILRPLMLIAMKMPAVSMRLFMRRIQPERKRWPIDTRTGSRLGLPTFSLIRRIPTLLHSHHVVRSVNPIHLLPTKLGRDLMSARPKRALTLARMLKPQPSQFQSALALVHLDRGGNPGGPRPDVAISSPRETSQRSNWCVRTSGS